MPGYLFNFANRVSYANLENIDEAFHEYKKLKADNKSAMIKQYEETNKDEITTQFGSYGLMSYQNLSNAAFDYIIKNIFQPDDVLKTMPTCICPLCRQVISNQDHYLLCSKMNGIHKRYHEIIVKMLITKLKPELGPRVCQTIR